MSDEAGRFVHWPRDEGGLPVPGRPDDTGGEPRRQHGGLKLQGAVADPQQPQRDLDPAPRHPGPVAPHEGGPDWARAAAYAGQYLPAAGTPRPRGPAAPEEGGPAWPGPPPYAGQYGPAGGPPRHAPSLAPGSLIHR